MPEFTAKDVQALRQASGAGMMDAKKALAANDGDFDAAAKWLRENGLAKALTRTDRDNSEGAVAIASTSDAAAIVELKCETDFVAKSDRFAGLAKELAELVVAEGEGAIEGRKSDIDDLKITLKENIDLGRVVRVAVGAGNVANTYLHHQDGRGVNAVIVELAAGTPELAHELAVHVAFTKPAYLRREEVPAAEVAEERDTLEKLSRAEGKPEAALPKIVDGRMNGWFADRVLLEQKYVKDEKQTIAKLLGDAELVRIEQVVVGG